MGDVVDPPSTGEEPYYPSDALGRFTRSATLAGGAGLLVAAVQNTVSRRNVGAMGVISTFGGTIGLFAGMGGAYAFVKTASANLREKEDPYNAAFGGFAAGSLIGLSKRSMPAVLGNGLAVGVVVAAIAFSGSVFSATPDAAEGEPLITKEDLRKRFRRPLNEAINEIGEGRGIYGAGYAERRKQRVKENYGIEIQEPYYKREAETSS